jgi:anti-anti-sigma factor
MLESQVRSMCTPDAARAALQEPFHLSAGVGPGNPPPHTVSPTIPGAGGRRAIPAASCHRPHRTAAPLSITVTLSDGRARLAVDGELDVFTSPQLVAVVDTVLRECHNGITFDLARLRFLDAAGLRAIAHDGVGASRAHVRVINAAPLARRLFHVVGLSGLVDLDDETVIEQGRVRGRHDSELEALADGLAWVSTQPPPGLVDEAMSTVVTLVGAVIADVKAVSVTLRHDKQLVTAAADGWLGRELDGLQYETGQGPCVEAAAEGTQVVGRLPEDADRWPQWATASRAHEVHGIVSTPIMVAGEPAGALNVYLQRHDLGDEDGVLPELLAAHAATMLVGIGASAHEDHSKDAFLVALAERDMVGRAEGALMERLGISADDADAELRRRSVAHTTTFRHEVEAAVQETQRQRPPSDARSNDRAE